MDKWHDCRCWGQGSWQGSFIVSKEVISDDNPSAKPGGFSKATVVDSLNGIQLSRLVEDDDPLGIRETNVSTLLSQISLRAGIARAKQHATHGNDLNAWSE